MRESILLELMLESMCWNLRWMYLNLCLIQCIRIYVGVDLQEYMLKLALRECDLIRS